MVDQTHPGRGADCLCGGTHITTREIDVLVRIAAGMSAGQIAVGLHISHRTVEYHTAAILRRIGAHNAVEAVARCYSSGILTPTVWPPQWSGRFCVAAPAPG